MERQNKSHLQLYSFEINKYTSCHCETERKKDRYKEITKDGKTEKITFAFSAIRTSTLSGSACTG